MNLKAGNKNEMTEAVNPPPKIQPKYITPPLWHNQPN